MLQAKIASNLVIPDCASDLKQQQQSKLKHFSFESFMIFSSIFQNKNMNGDEILSVGVAVEIEVLTSLGSSAPSISKDTDESYR